MFGEVRMHRAVQPSDLRHTTDEDLAAISVRAGRYEGAASDRPIPPVSVTGFDPMQSFSLHGEGPASFDDGRAGSVTRLLAAPEVKPHEAIGRVVAGRYAVRRVVGTGGMASVLEADDGRTGERVAMKVMHGDYARDPEIVARFQREARAAAAVDNPHIVRVIDVGRDDTIGLFLVMELLEGEDLGALLARESAVLPLTAFALIRQAADGLARAHEASILHRDVKPANLFLARRDGVTTVKLLDFGIAKLDEAGSAGLTRVGTVLGTPQYMSPEQAQARALGPRSDVYSLGAVLFEMLAGRPLVSERETLQEMLLAAATEVPPPILSVVPDLDPRAAAIVDDMLFRDPSLRPEMDAVARRLAALDPRVSLPIATTTLDGARRATTERRLRASGAPTAILAPRAKAARPPRAAAKKELPLVPMALAFFACVVALVYFVTR